MQHNPDQVLQGRTVLLVDDDLRNTFALSKLLKKHGMNVVIADNGQMALDKLQAEQIHRADHHGHHDAGDGWLSGDARDPRAEVASRTCRSSPSPRAPCPRNRRNAWRPAPTTT